MKIKIGLTNSNSVENITFPGTYINEKETMVLFDLDTSNENFSPDGNKISKSEN